MKRKIFYLGGLIVFIFLGLYIFIFVQQNNNFTSTYKREIKLGNELIKRIEDYRLKNGTLPEKLNYIYSESEKEKFEIFYYDVENQLQFPNSEKVDVADVKNIYIFKGVRF